MHAAAPTHQVDPHEQRAAPCLLQRLEPISLTWWHQGLNGTGKLMVAERPDLSKCWQGTVPCLLDGRHPLICNDVPQCLCRLHPRAVVFGGQPNHQHVNNAQRGVQGTRLSQQLPMQVPDAVLQAVSRQL